MPLIFAGPKVMLDENVPPDTLKEAGDVDFPVFYMNYNLNPQAVPWKDAISHTVKFFRGTEYTISRPARPLVCRIRNGLAHSKIKEREGDFVHLKSVGA